MTESILARILGDDIAILGKRTLCDNDDRCIGLCKSRLDIGADSFQIERDLWDEDAGSATCETGMKCDPASMTPHHFHDEGTMMGLGGRVETIDRLDRDVDRSIESECVIGVVEIIVDRLRDADHLHTQRVELRRHA